MAVELIRRGLPKPWSFAVTRDGRIFFINDEMRTTTWLHPVTGEPVCTGNTILPNLPAGWERSVNAEGIEYYIDHNRKETSFIHPVTQLSAIQYKSNVTSIHQPHFNISSDYTQSSFHSANGELRKSQKKKGQHIRSPVVKRNSHSPVSMEGWLYKLEGGALKQWRKRWFVLADFCLFYYKGPDEEKVLGSILLPSYKISACSSDDKISRKFAFKAEHHNMKTYYFASDSKEGMAQWMNVMSLASIVQNTLSPEMTSRNLSPKISLPNDDEDSGFTSYKSRRYGSTQDPNSTLNSSFASEQLHFQHSSNEFGKDNFSDSSHITGKLSENEFLGSGDKYPGHYGSDISRPYSTSPDTYMKAHQPLYANAPPKPKRTGQKDPYAIAPNEQYNIGTESIDERFDMTNQKHLAKSFPYRYGASCPRLSNEQSKYVNRDNEYNKISFDYVPHNETVYNDNYSTNPYKSPTHNKNIPPARPHSADFLEHDSYSDPFNAPIAYRPKSSSKKKSSQPQRPKSSLECYDPYRYGNEDIYLREDDKEYWQKENLPHSHMNYYQDDNNSFEKQNINYYSLQNMPVDQQYCKDDVYEHFHKTPETLRNKSQKLSSNSEIAVDKKQSNNRRNRENRPASTGYQIGTSLQSTACPDDKKSQLREESMKRLLEWKQRMLQSPLSRKYPQRLIKTQDQANDLEAPPRPPLPEEYHKHVLQELENHEAQLQMQEKLHKENKEKQEILVPSPEMFPDKPRLQKNINDKDNSLNEEQIQRNARSPSRSQEHRRSSSSLGRLNNNYSSDDDEEYNIKDRKRTRRPSQSNKTRRSSIEKCSATKTGSMSKINESPSPDYVNIRTLDDSINNTNIKCEVFGRSSKIRSIPAEEDLRNLAVSEESLKSEGYPVQIQDVNTYSRQYSDYKNHSDEPDLPLLSKSTEDDDKKEYFQIKKEDYYKASQLFYSLSQGTKVKEKYISKSNEKQKASDISQEINNENNQLKPDIQLQQKPADVKKGIETYDTHYWKNVGKPSCTNWELDKDVGLPLPPYPGSARMKDARQKKMQLRINSFPRIHKLDNSGNELMHNKSDSNCQSLNFSPPSSLLIDNNAIKNESLAEKTHITKLQEKNKSENLEIPSHIMKNCSFEEMRTFLQKQKEAPPPNIVQNRIKHFEQTSPNQSNGEIKKNVGSNEKQKKEISCKNLNVDSHLFSENASEILLNKENITYNSSIYPRQFFSDSEAVLLDDSKNDESNEEIMTNKSAPLILSPLSSVLADLRRTADTGREKKSGKEENGIDEIIITKGALRLSLVEDKETGEISSLKISKAEEEAYLPMSGKKNSEEPEYVAMDEDKSKISSGITSCLKDQTDKPSVDDEPLYNEPISPPPSFLHDVYEKSKHSHFPYDLQSSGNSSSENIYEKPKYLENTENLPIKSTSNKPSLTSLSFNETSQKSLYSMKNHSSNDIYEITNIPNKKPEFPEMLNFSPNRLHPPEKPLCMEEFLECDIPSQLNDSIPDLLQMKDSDASDADDEASRDFDTPKNLSLPPYQTAILLGEQSSVDDHMSTDDDHNAQTLFLLSKNMKIQDLSDNESTTKDISTDLLPKTTKIAEPDPCESDLIHSLSHQTCNDENRFSDFLHNMIPMEKEYLTNKSNNEKQVTDFFENKKLRNKSSLPIIHKHMSESIVNNSEKSSLDVSNVNFFPNEVKSEHSSQNSERYLLKSSGSLPHSLEIISFSDPNQLICENKIDCATNSTSPCASLTPDVVPADDRDDTVTNKKSNRQSSRLPNAAPYYYSDLLPDTDDIKLLKSPLLDKCYSPRSNQNMLNNVRDISPSNSNKGDIGRKVNKISENNQIISPNNFSSTDISNCQQNLNQRVFPSEISHVSQEVRNSLEHLLIPESSKFRDAERNKYEAGHTLEKTRSTSSTLQCLKQRSATPDFNKSYEHHYENLDPVWGATVKRLSRSLEELLDGDSKVRNQNDWLPYHFSNKKIEEPFYENIGFAQHKLITETDDSFEDIIKDRDIIASPQVSPAKHTIFDTDQINFTSSRNKEIFSSLTRDYTNETLPKSTLSPKYEDHDSDIEYLDQNVLRNASKRHFLGRFSKERNAPQLKTQSSKDESFELYDQIALDSFLAEGQRSNYDGGGNNIGPLLSRESNSQLNKTLGKNLLCKYSHHEVLQRHQIKNQNSVMRTERQDIREQDFFNSSSDSSTSVHLENEGSSMQKLSSSYSVNDKLDSLGDNNIGVFRTCKEDPNMSDSEIHVRTPSRLKKLVHQSEGLSSQGKHLSISAGDLLGKTHEELVLLLIQLRRNQHRIAKARQQCRIQLENEQYLVEIESSREEHFKKCEELRHQMHEFQKQFEMGQPLVNLVENMVKLGSLYGSERNYVTHTNLEENTNAGSSKSYMQLLALSRQLHSRQINCKEGSSNINLSEDSLEERLQQLCHSDRMLQDEFNTFTSLQQDRGILEITLDGIKKKVSEFRNNAVDIGRLYKQQRMIEKELSRVTRFLMQSIQKLECLSRENTKLEQDAIALKLQIKQHLQYKVNVENSSTEEIDIESELKRIQQIIDELSSHRKNINSNVEKVKAELKHKFLVSEVRASPTGVAGSIPLPIRKKHQSSYMETDLDTMETRNLAGHSQTIETDGNDIPLYANAEEINSPTKEKNGLEDPHSSLQNLPNQEYNPQDISEADDRMKMFYGIIPKDKPSEIKTVRIVKRESERRNRGRDKKKVTYDDNSLVWVVEEPEIFLYEEEDEVEEEVERLKQTLLLPNLYSRPTSLFSSQQDMTMSAHERLFGNYTSNQNFQESSISDEKSVSNDDLSPSRRNKRRHYTISGFSYNPLFKSGLRSCDDVDMERCLRTANTPDIVRSTIKKSDVFDDKIIDRELGLPQKINIPERYIDDDPEQLSATERLKRSLKAETIRRMLSETTTYEDIGDKQGEPGEMLKKRVDEEKKRRAHLLALNHALAREVMEKSKIVAANISSAESPYSLP
ncbi:uncharacterized protein [Centruroides vittatus]|uniref:uncharacterized protein isoform X2 n=1 Tax=Centruroides vittatus TaxID=120091 RepID=UPI00350E8ECF